MPEIIVTPGGPTDNSYATLAEANAYHDTRPSSISAAWTAATQINREAALITATELLDGSLVWTGSPATTTQALGWPRTGMQTRNGVDIPDDELPAPLKRATAEFARQLLVGNRMADDTVARQGLTSLAAGPIKMTWKEGIAATPPDGVPRVVPDAVKLILPESWYETPEEEEASGSTFVVETT
jgi:hypothetical protein